LVAPKSPGEDLFHVTFFIAKKVTKNASDAKNSLEQQFILFVSGFAYTLMQFPLSISFQLILPQEDSPVT
jgi:hypothetical protein